MKCFWKSRRYKANNISMGFCDPNSVKIKKKGKGEKIQDDQVEELILIKEDKTLWYSIDRSLKKSFNFSILQSVYFD